MSVNVSKMKSDASSSPGLGPLPGRKLQPGERPPIGVRKEGDVSISIGNIVSVDTDRMIMKVSLLGRRQGEIVENIDVPQVYAGTSSYIAVSPEIGSTVVLLESPTYTGPISYIPKYQLGLRQQHAVLWDKDKVGTNDKNEYFYRMRPLNQGDISTSSSRGAEIYLSDNVLLGTNKGENFKIRAEDNVILSTSLNSYVFACGIWSNSGIVQRNSIVELARDEGSYAESDKLLDENVNYNLRPSDNKESSDYFTEYRIEVEDRSKDDMPGNDVNRIGIGTYRRPVGVFSMGNFIGNNDRYDDTYGRVLRPALFNDYNDRTGDFFFDVLTGEEPDTIGMAFTLFAPDRRNAERGALFGADKEGHFYHYLPSGSGGGICPGRSLSLVAKGSRKEIWGADSKYGNSWDMVLSGGIRWNVGNHGESADNPHSNLSMDITTTKGAYLKYGVDQDLSKLVEFSDSKKSISNTSRYKKIEVVAGCERSEVEMTRETILGGSDLISINGKDESFIGGGKSTNVGDSYALTIGNNYYEKVSKEKQEGYGSRETSITSGKSVLNMVSVNPAVNSNIEENIKGYGSRITNLATGDITERIMVSGNRTLFMTKGNFEVTTTQGDLALKTAAGNVLLKTVAGNIEMSATMGMKLETKAGVMDIKGMSVDIKGTGGAISGVITVNSHKDYITGAPLMGSKSVRASL